MKDQPFLLNDPLLGSPLVICTHGVVVCVYRDVMCTHRLVVCIHRVIPLHRFPLDDFSVLSQDLPSGEDSKYGFVKLMKGTRKDGLSSRK